MDESALFNKIPFLKETPGFTLPCSLSLEQSSSQATAEFKASITKKISSSNQMFVDLTGGMGIDTLFISKHFKKSIYIEQNEELCKIASSNFKLLNRTDIDVWNGNSVELLSKIDSASVIYADPARRSRSGGKLVSIGECEPNILPILPLIMSKCDILMLKLSPMLDISIAIKELGCVSDIYVVSVFNECKEILAICKKGSFETKIECINLPLAEDFVFTTTSEHHADITLSMPQNYLYEPNASILKAGAFKSICRAFNVNKIETNSHLYTSDTLVDNFPGRCFNIIDVRKVHKEFYKDIDKANISTRNFPTSVAQIRKNLGIKEGGDIYLFATTLIDKSKRIIVTKKVSNK